MKQLIISLLISTACFNSQANTSNCESLFNRTASFNEKIDNQLNLIKRLKNEQLNQYLLREYKTTSAHNPNVTRVLENWSNDEVKPFVLSHGKKTEKSFVLVHGLSDSPYYLKHYAQFLFELGYNVVGVHLSGHGWDRAALADSEVANLNNWFMDVANGHHIASQMGEEVVGLGFSTGASLLMHLGGPQTKPIMNSNIVAFTKILNFSGLILINPALGYANTRANKQSPAFFKTLHYVHKFHETPSAALKLPYKYGAIATRSLGVLKELMESVRTNTAWFDAPEELIPPMFTLITENDTSTSPADTMAFLQETGLYKAETLMVFPKSENMAHIGLTRQRMAGDSDVFMTEAQFRRVKFRITNFIAALEAHSNRQQNSQRE
jgi:alpha-beta hydrolase superfamily lysophospholipase